MEKRAGGRRGFIAAAVNLLLAVSIRADTAVLPSGQFIDGKLGWQRGRLVFYIPSQPTRRLEEVEQVRLSATPVPPLRAARAFRLLLPDGERFTGELLNLDGQTVRFRPAWAPPLTVPRSVVLGITQLPGWLTFWDDDFEDDLNAWKTTGNPRRNNRQHTSGRQSLVLDAPGQIAQYSLPESLAAGRVAVNFFDPMGTSGSRWLVEAEFRTARGPRIVRAVVADEGSKYQAPLADSEGQRSPVTRSAGWHRLAMEFRPRGLIVSVDDDLLYVNRRQGPGGPLVKIRLVCAEVTAGQHRGQVFFDDVSLARPAGPRHRQPADPAQDEVWLREGDQLLGRLRRADRRTIDLEARFGRQTWPWGEVRGIFLRRQSTAPQTTQGEHATLWVQNGAGPGLDRLTGPVHALDEKRLTLHHPALGEVAIDRGRVRQIRWAFHGRRMVLDDSPHHLGPKGRTVADLDPPRAEGLTLRRPFRLDRVPAAARLRVRVAHLKGTEDEGMAGPLRRGELRTEVVVNGHLVDYLNHHVPHASPGPQWLTVSLPARVLRRGVNTVVIRQTPEKHSGHHESCGIAGLVVEIP
jgi:hypothetical protein